MYSFIRSFIQTLIEHLLYARRYWVPGNRVVTTAQSFGFLVYQRWTKKEEEEDRAEGPPKAKTGSHIRLFIPKRSHTFFQKTFY